jgi:hypothetical protein
MPRSQKMPKFKVWFYKCYEIEVEANDKAEAHEIAWETPLEQWWEDQWGQTEIEQLDEFEESVSE